jgi:hypothetical protein
MGGGSKAESAAPEITMRTRKKYGTEEMIWIVLEGLRKEISVAKLSRKERMNPNVYYHEVIASTHVEHGSSGSRQETIAMCTGRISVLPARKRIV